MVSSIRGLLLCLTQRVQDPDIVVHKPQWHATDSLAIDLKPVAAVPRDRPSEIHNKIRINRQTVGVCQKTALGKIPIITRRPTITGVTQSLRTCGEVMSRSRQKNRIYASIIGCGNAIRRRPRQRRGKCNFRINRLIIDMMRILAGAG